MNKSIDNKTEESPPPIFGSWNKLYGFVLFALITQVILFYIFTKVFE